MQKIIISGASSGFGLELTKELSKKYYIICFSRRYNLLKKNFSRNKNVEYYRADLSNLESTNSFLIKLKKKHSDIFIVINNAGQMVKCPVHKPNIKMIKNIYNLNVFSPHLIMKHFIPKMQKKKFGRIVNITSGAPLNNYANYSLYSSTKAALNSLTLTAYKENINNNIYINLLSPGSIKTEMTSHFKAKFLPIDQAIRDVKKLISIKNKINGKFVWRGKIIPLIPNLNGVDWAKGSSTGKFKKI